MFVLKLSGIQRLSFIIIIDILLIRGFVIFIYNYSINFSLFKVKNVCCGEGNFTQVHYLNWNNKKINHRFKVKP